MARPNEYHWDDVGSPPLEPKAGSILEIFKACLITGYGSKPSAGWKLQYDGWTAKGEQRLAFSVGDETEQELIYWLEDDYINRNSHLSLWARLNDEKNSPLDRLCNNALPIMQGQPLSSNTLSNPEWHLYATNKFCYFFWEVQRTNENKGKFIAFGAAKDLSGEFLPQVIIGYQSAEHANRKQEIISSGGTIFLPKQPYSSDIPYFAGSSLTMPSGIEYFLPIIAVYQPLNADATIRLYIPALTLSPSDFRDSRWWKVKEKAGAKIGIGVFFNSYSLGFDIGSDWDSPAWLNQIING